MFWLWTLEITTADIPSNLLGDGNPFPREWQTILMDKFYSQIAEDGLAKYSRNKRSRDYCRWKGVRCTSVKPRLVTKVTYLTKHFGNMDVHSLPPTVEHISITHCMQRYALHTRSLPRALQLCHLNNNLLFGSLDLQTLPENLVDLNLSYNQLSGPIDLTHLPQNLEELYLARNLITQSVAFVGRLPRTLTSIRLTVVTNPTNHIGKLRVLHPESLDRVSELFLNFPTKKIRCV
ncbi:leucine-rich repeat [Perkinsela sp. CCAP 1560/4]|nr:leucine-rich repeat [Perkinsela sp. CCAP 1560/4]|eukprot:KNH07181.1 leucine-rich repeat [Perkinsela sp. CCAP 1560/4]